MQFWLVAVGNEPFMRAFNGTYMSSVLPAMQHVQEALVDAGLSSQVKVTVVINSDVYQSASGKPFDGDFRNDIHALMLEIAQFLASNGGPITVNVHLYISLYNNPSFPLDFAFSQGSSVPVVNDGFSYSNYFDTSHDTGGGTSQDFNQAVVTHINSSQGTPLRPGPVDAYLSSIIDEDKKNIDSGHFERHWGIFYYDGTPKYEFSLHDGSGTLTPARDVKYLEKHWCILNPADSLTDEKGYISYAYNSYYQLNNQDDRACYINGLANTTDVDPSFGTFNIATSSATAMTKKVNLAMVLVAFLAFAIQRKMTEVMYWYHFIKSGGKQLENNYVYPLNK